MDMLSFQHITPPLRLFHGADSLAQLARELDRLKATRAVIFCGSTLARQGTLLELVRGAIGERCAGVFSGVRAHSPLPSVEAAAAELKRLGADAAIAIGGGSAIVTARAASILAAEDRNILELCTTQDDKGALKSPKLLANKIAQFVIPTTPTTAMVKAGSAVFEPESGKRLALFDPKTRATAVFIHPDMVMSAPRELIVSASLNTLAMCIEGLTSRTGNPIADGLLMHSMRLLSQHLSQPALQDDPRVRGELMLAALMCGQGTDATAAGIMTVLGHAIGARFDTENGLANAIVMPHVLRFNAEAAVAGSEKVAVALGLPKTPRESQGAMTGYAIKAIFSALGIPSRLRDIKVPREALADIAATAMGDWFLRGNPRPVREASELQQILEEAW